MFGRIYRLGNVFKLAGKLLKIWSYRMCWVRMTVADFEAWLQRR